VQLQEDAGDAKMRALLTMWAGMSHTVQSHTVPPVARSAALCFSHYFNYRMSNIK